MEKNMAAIQEPDGTAANARRATSQNQRTPSGSASSLKS
jgi:hypothetical protein